MALCLICTLACCHRSDDAVFIWECPGSVLYLNSMDTVCTVHAPLSEYDMYLSVRHQDDCRMAGLRFVISVSSPGMPVVEDTLAVPLADTCGQWAGTPYIGAYVQRVPAGIDLPVSDSAEISLTPVIPQAVRGVDWLALELVKK